MELISFSGIEMSEVERGSDSLPRAWPLLKLGDNIITRRDKMPVNLRLNQEDLAAIVEYHRAKGVKIPLDCQHVISNLAGKIGMDEADLLKKLPRYSGVAGFGSLELRGDAIYLAEAEFLPIGQEVMKAGQFRYYSPSIRGLDGESPLRITSVALTNTPCLQNTANLAASEDDEEVTPEMVLAAQELTQLKKEAKMPEEPTAAANADAAEAARKNAEEIMKILKEILGDDISPESLRATLDSLKNKSESSVELSETDKKLECAEETRSLEAAKAKGLRRGVITPAILATPFIAKMKAVELAEYIDSLPDGCAAPVGMLELSERVEPAVTPQASKLSPVRQAIAGAKTTDMKGF